MFNNNSNNNLHRRNPNDILGCFGKKRGCHYDGMFPFGKYEQFFSVLYDAGDGATEILFVDCVTEEEIAKRKAEQMYKEHIKSIYLSLLLRCMDLYNSLYKSGRILCDTGSRNQPLGFSVN